MLLFTTHLDGLWRNVSMLCALWGDTRGGSTVSGSQRVTRSTLARCHHPVAPAGGISVTTSSPTLHLFAAVMMMACRGGGYRWDHTLCLSCYPPSPPPAPQQNISLSALIFHKAHIFLCERYIVFEYVYQSTFSVYKSNICHRILIIVSLTWRGLKFT